MRRDGLSLLLTGVCLLTAPLAQAADSPPVTQDQLNTTNRYLRNIYDRVVKMDQRLTNLEKSASAAKPGASSANGTEETVNLGETQAPVSTASMRSPHQTTTTAQPTFKVYFDLDLIRYPGKEDFSFDNIHSFLFFEIIPTPDLMFSFDVGPNGSKFYELDYNLTPKLTVRAGKIWIPFDDLSPHNIFGGRVNVSKLSISPTGAQFLPDIWTDLGVGLKYQIVDTRALNALAHVYVVNGFQSGGTDPKGVSPIYPNFSTTGVVDQNTDKSVGARLALLFGGTVGVGASFFTGRWSPDSAGTNNRLNAYGIDGRLRLGNLTEVRGGMAVMTVDLPGDSFARGGFYGELAQKFGSRDQFRFLARGGQVQLDNRVIDVTDQLIVGGALVYSPGMVELWGEYNQDLKQVPGKTVTSYAALRMVVAL